MAKNLGYAELASYSDSLDCINLTNVPIERYHIYAILIKDIKNASTNQCNSFSHSLRGDQCADYMEKLEASSDDELLLHNFPLMVL